MGITTGMIIITMITLMTMTTTTTTITMAMLWITVLAPQEFRSAG